MTLKDYKRQHLRAPLVSPFVYSRAGRVLKGLVENISEGGMLLKHMPPLHLDEEIWGVFEIVQYPVFSHYKFDELNLMDRKSFNSQIIRVQIRPVRKVELKGEGNIVSRYIGVVFLDHHNEKKIVVSDYVKTFTKNIIFLLKKIESNIGNGEMSEIRLLAELLGYPKEIKISNLRQKVLHDYQNLQWA